MASYLYVLSIGPVQDFIVAARRTKDLWYGSYLLSVISKAAAREISHLGGYLIFPGLDKRDFRLESLESDFSVANVILARLPDGCESPEVINEKAQDAAKRVWIDLAEKAKKEAGKLVRQDKIGQDIWNDQVDDAIEFYAAWVPEGVSYDRMKVMRLLAGRKSIRNFRQPKGFFGIPKSSLDGARESVIQRDKALPKWLSMKLRLSDAEQLCAVGLTKRLGRRPDGKNAVFPSVVRVAADPWIRGIRRHPGDKANRILDEIEACCREGENSFSTGIGDRLYQEFRSDGHILYPSRLARAKEDLNDILDQDEDNPYIDDLVKLDRIEKAVNQLQKKDDGGLGLGEPNQYLAVLKADGDRMGKALFTIDSVDNHRAFSGLLAEFASDAKRIVEEEYHGCMVFSGGDDVLAFLPLDTCLGAARALHDGFREKGEKLTALQGYSCSPLTLSVGIAIGHYLEPLENLLNFGNEAEKAAKDGRDAQDERDGLAVHIYPRSGAPIKIREKWLPEKANGLDERLRKWAKMHCENKLPDSAAYEMRELAEDYKDWKTSSKDEEDKLRDLIASDALRLLKRKTGILGPAQLQKEDLKGMLMNAEPYQAISRMASELILARRIAVAMKQAGDEKSPKQVRQTQEVA
ncbi:MAG: type III-B CRISPR-associated protein Cas10/Cmr2 [Methanothrix sp.]